jgi:hypothetical protein
MAPKKSPTTHNTHAGSQRDPTPTFPEASGPASTDTPTTTPSTPDTGSALDIIIGFFQQVLNGTCQYVPTPQSTEPVLACQDDLAKEPSHLGHLEWMSRTAEWTSNSASRTDDEFRRRFKTGEYLDSDITHDMAKGVEPSKLRWPDLVSRVLACSLRPCYAWKTLQVFETTETVEFDPDTYKMSHHRGEFRLQRRNLGQTPERKRSSAEFKRMFVKRPAWMAKAGEEVSKKRKEAWARITTISGLRRCARLNLIGAYSDLNSES